MDADHWTDELDYDGLHEPTVRAIATTMRRTGAGFGAAVLEAQCRNGQIEGQAWEKVQAMRDLADFVEEHDDWPIATEGTRSWRPLTIWCDDVEDMNAKRRAIGGRWEKHVTETSFQLNGRIGGAFVTLHSGRDKVCERVVVGTETKLVRDPDAPMVETEVEVVEWVCPDALLGVSEEDA